MITALSQNIKHLPGLLLLLLLIAPAYGQVDSNKVLPQDTSAAGPSKTSATDSLTLYQIANDLDADTTREKPKHKVVPLDQQTHSPKKAAILSAIVPGLGQIYNKKYWKLPIIYGGLGAGIYAINFNQYEYKLFLNAFEKRLDDNPTNDDFVGIYDNRQLIELQNFYRRYRDLSIMLTIGGYALQILDAYIDAHLFYYDVSKDLTLRWQPTTIHSLNSPDAFGMGLTISLR